MKNLIKFLSIVLFLSFIITDTSAQDFSGVSFLQPYGTAGKRQTTNYAFGNMRTGHKKPASANWEIISTGRNKVILKSDEGYIADHGERNNNAMRALKTSSRKSDALVFIVGPSNIKKAGSGDFVTLESEKFKGFYFKNANTYLSLHPKGNADGTFSWTAIGSAASSNAVSADVLNGFVGDGLLELWGPMRTKQPGWKYAREDLRALGEDPTSWTIIEKGGGKVVLKNASGYIKVSKRNSNRTYSFGYARSEKDALQFIVEKPHAPNQNQGFVSLLSSEHPDYYLKAERTYLGLSHKAGGETTWTRTKK